MKYMVRHLIFIEGIQGSGKSTLAKKIRSHIRSSNINARIYYRNESPNPLDLSRLAFLGKDELQHFITICGTDIKALLPYLHDEIDYYTVNWLDFINDNRVNNSNAIEYALQHELCDGRSGYKEYKRIMQKRWDFFLEQFSHDSGSYFLFEGTVFQHLLAELIGYYLCTDDEILSFVSGLISNLVPYNPILYYILADDPEKTILSAFQERTTAGSSWGEGILKWIQSCNYGKMNGLHGVEGLTFYCKERIRIEKMLISELPIKSIIINRM